MQQAVLKKQLEDGLDALAISLSETAQSSLLLYCHLLNKWNKTYNLTSIKSLEQMVSHHLLDSLAVSPHLADGRIIDVGTGPGLPGIPLAIAHPDKEFTLLDSNGKKTRFLMQAVGELGLKNVQVVKERAETYQPSQLFDVVISRAYASIVDILTSCEPLLAAKGKIFAMKGKYPKQEIQRLASGFQLVLSVELKVPGLNAERHLLMLERT